MGRAWLAPPFERDRLQIGQVHGEARIEHARGEVLGVMSAFDCSKKEKRGARKPRAADTQVWQATAKS